MLQLADYTSLETVYQGQETIVYRAYSKIDRQPVIIKTLKTDYPNPKRLAQFHHEYEITQGLNLNWVIQPLALKKYENRWALIFEDIGGDSLQNVLQNQKLDLLTTLQIAIALTDGLGELHANNIIHKDIKPANVIINLDKKKIKITDFSISSRLSLESQGINNPNTIEGTLVYMSPEQTGRMNRNIDYRTDFYSLGALFYELLVGHPPFQSLDSMELVHCHIAKKPIAANELNPDVPYMLSKITMKLLSKTAEERYQSAYGLKVDLENCLRQYQDKKIIEEFICGGQDISDKFQIPQKLYGREQEIQLLLKSFDRVSHGRSEMMLVSGYSGIGKTSLVQEIYKPITEQRGYFISGKFDQYKRNVPYLAIINAFQELIRQLLTENETQLSKWREYISDALGKNAQLITDVIPDVELIIGTPEPVIELPPTEAQNRFHITFENFIRVFARPETPLVVFLDDLQWADIASLNLLQILMTAHASFHLMLIGTYRNNEVAEFHPLLLAIEDIKKTGTLVHQISLVPLELPSVNQLLSDALKRDLIETEELSELILGKTHGNPFFIEEFLKSLHEGKLLSFSYQTWSWQWNMSHIKDQDFTENVVEFMTDKIRQLEPQSQKILQLAACIGNRFDLRTLAIVCQDTLSTTLENLTEANNENLISTLNHDELSLAIYQLSNFSEDELDEDFTIQYKFGHDRIQQAAYSLIPKGEKQAIHHQIGRLLLENTPANRRDEKLFDIVNQLNLATDLIVTFNEKEQLAQLNLVVGKKAQAAVAYEAALRYLVAGKNLLPRDSWERQYDMTLALTVESAEAAYLNGEFDLMNELIHEVLTHAQALLDKVKVYEIKIQALVAQNQLALAVDTALFILKQLGISFPKKPQNYHTWIDLIRIQRKLLRREIADLSGLPLMRDPKKLAAMRIMSSAVMPALLTKPELFPLLVFRLVNDSIHHGNSPVSAYGYASYGMFLCSRIGNMKMGYEFGKLALNLVECSHTREMKTRILVMFNAFIRHFKEPLEDSLQPLLDAYHIGLETGDLEFTARSINLYTYYSYFAGKELSQVEDTMNTYTGAIQRLKQEEVLVYIKLYRQSVLNLMSDTDQPWMLMGESYNEEKMQKILQNSNKTAKCHYHINKLILCYLFHEYQEATSHSLLAENYIDSVLGLFVIPVFYFYDSLTQLALYHDVHKFQQEVILKKVRANQYKMKRWAKHSPNNFLHKYYLVEAEQQRILGNTAKAINSYDYAIDLAKKHGFLNDEALSHELATQFYLSLGKSLIAKAYFREASYCYLRWGATRKVKELEESHPELLPPAEKAFTTMGGSYHTTTHGKAYTTMSTTTGSSTSFDIMTIMKASQTLSGEIVLDRLVQKLIHIVMENVGAEEAWLIRHEQKELNIEAYGYVEKGDVFVSIESQSVDCIDKEGSKRLQLAKNIVSYVARTQTPVVLDNAIEDELFGTDSYIKQKQPKSILCVPIMYQTKLTGIIYLENNLTTEAFTPERLIMLKLLSTQIAISLENALFYEKLETARFSAERAHKSADRARQQAEAANQAKTTFLANMSHELRTPLNAILGYSEIIRDDAEDMGYEDIMPDLDKINAAGNHLVNIISDILNLSKIEADKLDLQLGEFNVEHLIDEVCNTIQPIVDSDHNQLEIEKMDDLGEMYSDYHKLSQILLNILNNAVKFSEKTKVIFTINMITDGKTEWLEFSVTDFGIGIPVQRLDKIFEPFTQADNSSTRSYDGTGLGLTISKRFCEALNGIIEVESEVDQGSTFTVRMPRKT
ncbi:ATP-binding sensor histidine kinase [Candidatus Albibeggiatoa sp. nov. BB20]|uniref:ATP-binding sensor histidine kinase n=1 Tax=Candidatus Albibeggiatoa sp. nov. BB20 TaxID=3162723 RepID=UPI0033653269